MNFNEKLEKLKFCSNQIIHFDPEPYYVDHFFKEYLITVLEVYRGILKDAERDFGLFLEDMITLKNFEEKAKEKGDEKALEFLEWYTKTYEEKHKLTIPKFIRRVIQLITKNQEFPKSKIMLTSKNRYKNDPTQELEVVTSIGKIRSRLGLNLEFKRQLPMFLLIVNKKRKENNEPIIKEDEVILRAFSFNKDEKVEIFYAVEVYLQLLVNFVDESNKKVRELTTWK